MQGSGLVTIAAICVLTGRLADLPFAGLSNLVQEPRTFLSQNAISSGFEVCTVLYLCCET